MEGPSVYFEMGLFSEADPYAFLTAAPEISDSTKSL